MKNCEEKLNRDNYYGTKQEFERAHARRKERLLREYMERITDREVREEVEKEIKKILK